MPETKWNAVCGIDWSNVYDEHGRNVAHCGGSAFTTEQHAEHAKLIARALDMEKETSALHDENQKLRDALRALCYPSRSLSQGDGTMIGWADSEGPNVFERTLNARKLLEPTEPANDTPSRSLLKGI